MYVEGRSREWLKVKVNQEDEFIILGYTEPSGSREYFGTLLLGAHKNGRLQYVGRVGTGFTRDALASLYHKFKSLKRKQSPVEERREWEGHRSRSATAVFVLSPPPVFRSRRQRWLSQAASR
jgi:ATP-dependent DNA ligase